MRKSLTEREVYRKLKILERHSAFKQPYKFKSHPVSELNYEFPGYPWPGGPSWPPYPDGPSPEDCDFGCNPSMLDCEGGCTTIVCTCPISEAYIVDDPTEAAWLILSEYSGEPLSYGEGTGAASVGICIPDTLCDGPPLEEFPKILVELVSFDGQSSIVEVAIVDCRCCCEEFSITGNDTVNPGGDWVGTIDPPCPGAQCEAESTSGCDFSGDCTVSADGSTVTMAVAANDCGGIKITVTGPCGETATANPRINNTGQGGSWQHACGNWFTSNCPRGGCPIEYVYFGEIRAELKCGNLGADCFPKTMCRTATGSEDCAGTEYCWSNACCACDGINEITLDWWNCTC